MRNISQNDDRIRIGAVNYLNTKPLIYGLAELAPKAELVLDYPSRLADRLAAGELDVALIPSIEYFQDPSYTIVSDACIATRGPVLSVKLFSRRKLEDIKTLALDEGSRTSAALVRVLLKERYGIVPQLEPLPVDDSLADTSADAVLLIGDRAIHSPAGAFEFVWDLGDQWTRWTNLPFVFAMWTARHGVDLRGVDIALAEARDLGVSRIADIAEQEAPRLALTVPQCAAYLRENLYFFLGPQERRGLRRYYERASAMGLAPQGVEIEYAGSPVVR